MKFVRPIFESLSKDTTITTSFLRNPSIKELEKLKSHIFNIYRIEIYAMSATFNNKDLWNFKVGPTSSIFKGMVDS